MKIISIPDGEFRCCCGDAAAVCCALTSDDTLILTIESDCAGIDGLTWDLTWDAALGRWSGEVPDGECIEPATTPSTYVVCDGVYSTFGDWRDVLLFADWLSGDCGSTLDDTSGTDGLAVPDSGACDPFALRFAATMGSEDPPCDCGCDSYPQPFTVVITVKP